MTTTTAAAQIGTTAWYLTGIRHTEGTCDHCGRGLKHLYDVVDPDGREMTLGRSHVKAATGWTLSYAQAEQALRSARRGVEMDRRRAVVAEAYPELLDSHLALERVGRDLRAAGWDPQGAYFQIGRLAANRAALFSTATHEDGLWNGRLGWSWREYLSEHAGPGLTSEAV
jgi:hypothetical protein